MCSGAFGMRLLDPRDVEKDAAVRAAAPGFDLAHDAARDVVARQELRRTPRVLVALGITPAFVGIVGCLILVVVGNVVEHEAAAFAIAQHAAFAANAFRHQDALDARRPDHSRRVELDELHVHQLGAGAIRQRVTVPCAFPAVARDAIRAADATRRQDHCASLEHAEAAALAIVAERPDDARALVQEGDDRELHVDVEAAVNPVILKRPDQLEAGAIADVREAWIFVAAKIALQDAAIRRAIEERAPGLELAHAIGRFPGVELGHPPVVDVLAAAHGVGEVHLPAVAVVDVGKRRRDAAFGHDRVRLPEKRFAEQSDFDPGRRRFDCRAEPGSACADDEHIVLVSLVTQRASSPSERPSNRGGRRDRQARPRRGWPTRTSCGGSSGSWRRRTASGASDGARTDRGRRRRGAGTNGSRGYNN